MHWYYTAATLITAWPVARLVAEVRIGLRDRGDRKFVAKTPDAAQVDAYVKLIEARKEPG